MSVCRDVDNRGVTEDREMREAHSREEGGREARWGDGKEGGG